VNGRYAVAKTGQADNIPITHGTHSVHYRVNVITTLVGLFAVLVVGFAMFLKPVSWIRHSPKASL